MVKCCSLAEDTNLDIDNEIDFVVAKYKETFHGQKEFATRVGESF